MLFISDVYSKPYNLRDYAGRTYFIGSWRHQTKGIPLEFWSIHQISWIRSKKYYISNNFIYVVHIWRRGCTPSRSPAHLWVITPCVGALPVQLRRNKNIHIRRIHPSLVTIPASFGRLYSSMGVRGLHPSCSPSDTPLSHNTCVGALPVQLRRN